MSMDHPVPVRLGFARMIYNLCRLLAAQGLANPAMLPTLVRVALRLRRALLRMLLLLAALDAGTLPSAVTRRSGESRRRAGGNSPPRLDERGWLLRLVPDIADSYTHSVLEHLLERPQVRALLAAAPLQAGRVLRPLCRALDVPLPDALRRSRRQGPPRQDEPTPDAKAPAGRKRGAAASAREPQRENDPGHAPWSPEGGCLRGGPAYG